MPLLDEAAAATTAPSPSGGVAARLQVLGPVALALGDTACCTQPGHSTDTFTCGAIIASSWCSVSESATTACLLALYGPMNGAATRPATDAVFTMCASRLLHQQRHERAHARG